MWSGEPFAWEGIGWRMPERRVLPTPVQRPHPPLWVTVTTPGTELDAADRGIGCLGVAAVSFAEQERRTAEYRRRIELCDPVGGVNNRVTTQNFLYCHEDLDHAAAVGGAMAADFNLANSHLLWTREAYPTSAYQSLGNQATQQTKETGAPGERKPLPEGIAIGDPARIVEQIRRWESVGIDGINFMLNSMEKVPQEAVLDSLRLFAAEVMPKFRS
jgi:alkanesulfonate monooxygenase SsuD/methylene tetrahydromethanopterin reductase-like flavin-dependent oxidoreductase (luciferase family)